MFCCQGCNLQTQTTLTAVLFVDQLASQRANILSKYAYKHLKNMHQGSHNQTISVLKPKENQQNQSERSNRGKQALRTIRKRYSLAVSELTQRQEDMCETGRFRGGRELTQGSSLRQSKKNMDSKTTSFGSLASRTSHADFLKKTELKLLQEELDNLREEQMGLLRQKLQKDYQYRREMLRLGSMKQSLKEKSQQRQVELSQLKQVLVRKTGVN